MFHVSSSPTKGAENRKHHCAKSVAVAWRKRDQPADTAGSCRRFGHYGRLCAGCDQKKSPSITPGGPGWVGQAGYPGLSDRTQPTGQHGWASVKVSVGPSQSCSFSSQGCNCRCWRCAADMPSLLFRYGTAAEIGWLLSYGFPNDDIARECYLAPDNITMNN